MSTSKRGGGPQTAAGKTASSQNALKFGITSAKLLLLSNETQEAWDDMLEMCLEQFQPTTRYERSIVEEIALAKWRLRRLATIEGDLMENSIEGRRFDLMGNPREYSSEEALAADAWKVMADHSKALTQLIRQQTSYERSIERAVKSLRELRTTAAKELKTAEAKPALKAPRQENAKRTQKVVVLTPAEHNATSETLQNELESNGQSPSAVSPLDRLDSDCPETAHRT